MNILLDFDGVVLRNERICSVINDRSIQYVAKKKNMRYNDAKTYNSRMYKSRGHTALSFDNSMTYHDEVCEYNLNVFHNLDFNQDIRPHINEHDVSHINELLLSFEGGKKPGLFTNTPLLWVHETLGMLGFDIDEVFDTDLLFTSDKGLVKPKLDAYEYINRCCEDEHIVFIDDSEKNINACEKYDNWIGLHVPTYNKTLLYSLISTLCMIDDIVKD